MSIKFNYQGLDSEKNQKALKENLLLVEQELRKIYLQRLETFNKQNLEHNPEPFRFLNKDNCSILAFILPFEYNNSICGEVFFLSTPGDRTINVKTLSNEDLSDLDSYQSSNRFFYDKILPKFGYHNTEIIVSTKTFYNNLYKDYCLFSKSINIESAIHVTALDNYIIGTIKDETQHFKKINQKPLSYFAKDAYKFPFSILDLKPLVELVDDDDFSYQLDQAMAAYHENLFLPCAATLGVVLETLCIKVLDDNGIKRIKSGDTQLGRLRERLMNEQIITRRDNTRLEVAYKMRNMASHSSPGVALKEDCHFMLNVINTIALEYLKIED